MTAFGINRRGFLASGGAAMARTSMSGSQHVTLVGSGYPGVTASGSADISYTNMPTSFTDGEVWNASMSVTQKLTITAQNVQVSYAGDNYTVNGKEVCNASLDLNITGTYPALAYSGNMRIGFGIACTIEYMIRSFHCRQMLVHDRPAIVDLPEYIGCTAVHLEWLAALLARNVLQSIAVGQINAGLNALDLEIIPDMAYPIVATFAGVPDAFDADCSSILAELKSACCRVEIRHDPLDIPRPGACPGERAIKQCVARAASAEGYASETASQCALHASAEAGTRLRAFLAERRGR